MENVLRMGMLKPIAVVFDLGNVLLDFDFAVAASNLAARCRVPVRELQGLLDQSPLLHRYETGLLTSEEFFAEWCGGWRAFKEFL